MGVVTSYDRCGWLDDASMFLCKSKIVYKIEVSIVVAVGSSGILKGKQKLGVTFNSDKLGGIDFTKF